MRIGRPKTAVFHETVMQQRQKARMKGPAGGGDSSFGDGLAAAARAVISDGRRALTEPELSDPEAVHEVRKALKRWRALLRLLAHPLRSEEHTSELQSLRHLVCRL